MILIENAEDIVKLLKAQKIKPENAIYLYSKMRSMMHVEFSNQKEVTPIEVINQIKHLETLENPIAFWQTEQQFSIKNIFNANQLN